MMGTNHEANPKGKGQSYLRGPVLIIGAGLLGASIGLALRARGIETIMDDVSFNALDTAVSIGAGRALTAADKVKDGLSDRSFKPQLVVIAAPPEVTATLVIRALDDWPHSVVVDVASVKNSIATELIRRKGRNNSHKLSPYVGSHPMAGRERHGAAAAQRDLFLSMPWVIVPLEIDGSLVSSQEAVETAEGLAMDCQAAVVKMDPLAHDQAVALVSHAPQVVASLMAARLCTASNGALKLAGQGLRDVTRIAASDPQLWAQIFNANAGFLREILRGLREDLDRMLVALDTADKSGVTNEIVRFMMTGNAGQARIPGKHGDASAEDFTTVQVLIDDAVGQLSALFADIEDMGVNVEDMRMEHAQGRPAGVVEISVLPAKAAEVIAVLEAVDQGSQAWKVLK